ncbi:unnamed protein product [Cuscuta campestris]|uniref:Replication factor A C-terminal domain-containing protein n=1 Tax=Cuscuta campestris TaxID=132261 RepID=A0A484MTK6_9ASTE|nr:unnamed protein product [Cuscuta campestris]
MGWLDNSKGSCGWKNQGGSLPVPHSFGRRHRECDRRRCSGTSSSPGGKLTNCSPRGCLSRLPNHRRAGYRQRKRRLGIQRREGGEARRRHWWFVGGGTTAQQKQLWLSGVVEKKTVCWLIVIPSLALGPCRRLAKKFQMSMLKSQWRRGTKVLALANSGDIQQIDKILDVKNTYYISNVAVMPNKRDESLKLINNYIEIKAYKNSLIALAYPPGRAKVKIGDISTSNSPGKGVWVSADIKILDNEGSYYIGCDYCNRKTTAPEGVTFTCLECGNLSARSEKRVELAVVFMYSRILARWAATRVTVHWRC